MIRPGPGRSPLDFVPASAQLAVHLDTRLANPGTRQALRYWSVSDLQRLGERGTELAQEVVDWAGFDLDVKKDVLPWYGGELVVAMVGLEGERPLGPDSVVLIARTKDDAADPAHPRQRHRALRAQRRVEGGDRPRGGREDHRVAGRDRWALRWPTSLGTAACSSPSGRRYWPSACGRGARPRRG